jgi:hypothetical protein
MKTATLCLPLLAIAACVSSGPESQLGKKEPRRIELSRTSDCVFHSSVSGFEALDDRHVVLFGMGDRKAYLAEIAVGCFDMKNQSALAAVDGDGNGQICGFGRDSVAYRNLGRGENCRITGLELLTDERRIELGLGVREKKPKKAEKQKKEGET